MKIKLLIFFWATLFTSTLTATMDKNKKTMKKLLLISTVFFGLSVAHGQTYHPLIEPNTFWDVMYTDMSQPAGCTYWEGFRYYFQGDTLIAGQQYHILHAYSVVSIGPFSPPLFCPPF